MTNLKGQARQVRLSAKLQLQFTKKLAIELECANIDSCDRYFHVWCIWLSHSKQN